MTPKNPEDDDKRFRKLKPLEQIHEVEDLIESIEKKIDDAERAKRRPN